MKFIEGKIKKTNKRYVIFATAGLLLLALVTGAVLVRSAYNDGLKPFSTVSKTHVVTIESGSTPTQIAQVLKNRDLIKSEWAFKWYVSNSGVKEELKAGTYVFDQTQSVQDIVQILRSGKVATDLVTILPGKPLSQTKADFIKAGFSHAEVESAFDPQQYTVHPALRDKPETASLEGYLYPETFQKTASTKLEDIITLSLDEMAKRLTDKVKSGIEKQGLSIHQAITLASIVENESATAEDRAKVASVFINRLKEGRQLQSNATDEYSKNNPAYDTYSIPALPPGPISNVSESSINAVAFPADTDYLFFVTADDLKTTYFSNTVEEHNALVRKYCKLNCAPH